MPIFYDRIKRRWRFEFNRAIDGRRYRSTKLLPASWGEDQARAYDRQEEARLYAIARGQQVRRLISEAISYYVSERLPRLKNGKKAAQDLAHLLPYIEGRYLDDAPAVATIYEADHQQLAPATLRNRLAYLKAAIRYAYKRHNIGDRDYTERMIMPSVHNERQTYLEVDGLERLLAKCPQAETASLLRLAFFTGLRWRAELLPMQSDQIVKTGRDVWLSIPDSKTGKPHMIYVHPSARQALKAIPFLLAEKAHYKAFDTARSAIGRPDLRIHDLRHSLASAMLSSGATLGEVGQALNHASVVSTRRYAHLYPKRQKEVIRAIGSGKKAPQKKKKCA